jgi:flavodoxin I
MRTALIYSFDAHNTSEVARLLKDELRDYDIEPINAEEVTGDQLLNYDNLIFGAPTWSGGELPNYWNDFLPELKEIDLKGKKVAIFGNGDQAGYPENFVDGIGIMAGIVVLLGAVTVGFVSSKGYYFEKSKALHNGKFYGLPIDFENQPEKTSDRIKKWAQQLVKEFGLQ